MIITRYTKEELIQARNVPLAAFLNDRYPGELERFSQGRYRVADDHSIKINEGISGYQNWADADDHGNSIEYLVNHHGMHFVDAVKELAGYASGYGVYTDITAPAKRSCDYRSERRKNFVLPEASNDYNKVMDYLCRERALPEELVQMLIKRKLLYQSKEHDNCVFASAGGNYYEMRGTNPKRRFSQSCGKTGNECWYFTPDGKSRTVMYITESAIDAISLFALLGDKNAGYAGIGGAQKQQAIERIRNAGISCIIATDNDKAGDNCREKNPDCRTIRPKKKDWNEDLQNK